MIAQQPIVDHLTDYAGFKTVSGLLEWAGLTEAPRAVPALFVVPQGDSALPNRMSGVIDQKVDETFGIIVVVEGQKRTGHAIDDSLKRDVDRVIDALVGWTHPEASRPTEYGGGRLISTDGYRVAWLITFKASSHIRKQSQ
jgi:hypothetical protein